MENNLTQAGGTLECLSVQQLENRARMQSDELNFTGNRLVMQTIDLGETLTAYKERTESGRHGNFLKFVSTLSVGERVAQNAMMIYRRFKDKPDILKLDSLTKIATLAALPAGTEEDFLRENDVERMSTREVTRAVKARRAEEGAKQREADGVAAAREDGETTGEKNRARGSNAARPGGDKASKELDELRRTLEEMQAQRQTDRDTIGQLTDNVRDAMEQIRAEQERARGLRQMVADSQQSAKAAQEKYLSLKSQVERASATERRAQGAAMTPAMFSARVRELISGCCELPQMGRAFSQMEHEEYEAYRKELEILESFAQSVRSAMQILYTESSVREGGVA